MEIAKFAYDFGDEIVEESGDGYYAYSYTHPQRLAWEAYFDFIVSEGLDPWETYDQVTEEIVDYAKSSPSRRTRDT